MSPEDLIKHLELRPLPQEGGFYREVYRSTRSVHATNLPEGVMGQRCAATDILFLLTAGTVSNLHRIRSDELWHYHLGGPLEVVELNPTTGRAHITTLGPAIEDGQVLQHTVPAHRWFGARLPPEVDYALVGCTVVSPGFDFDDFELAQRELLTRAFPHAKDTIEQLTADDAT